MRCRRGWGPKIWTFVTYAFLHADLNHLIFNLVWLLAFGPPIARRFGAVRFLVFCRATAAAGALAHLVTHLGRARADDRRLGGGLRRDGRARCASCSSAAGRSA